MEFKKQAKAFSMIFRKKNLHISRLAQFKTVLFKDQLYCNLWVAILPRKKMLF